MAAFRLGYGPLPSNSLRMPSPTVATPAFTNLHFGFNHSFISISSGFSSQRRRCHDHQSYSPGPVAIDRSNSTTNSGNEKGGGKVVRGAVGASLALACALSIIGCNCKFMNNTFKAIAGPKTQVFRKAPSFKETILQTPRKMAVKSLLDVTVSLASKDRRRNRPGPPSPSPRHLPPSKEQIDQLKMEAVNLMKHRHPDEALSMVKNEYKKYEMSEPETAYYLSMVLVEILICQGKYDDAFQFLSARDSISNFDVRPTLYKAIVCTMLDREEEANQLWKEFASSSAGMLPSGS